MEVHDNINMGEAPSPALACDRELFELASEIVWNGALEDAQVGPGTLKLVVTGEFIKRLRLRTRRALSGLATGRSEESAMTGPELFWMSANAFLHSESGKEFRLPVGELPVQRTNSRGRVVNRTMGTADRFHSNNFVNSLMLCLINTCGVAHSFGFTPLHVDYQSLQVAMRLMRQREQQAMKAWLALPGAVAAGWAHADLYYAGIYALFHGGLIRGEVRRFKGNRHGQHLKPGWHLAAANIATALGLVPPTPATPGLLNLLQVANHLAAPLPPPGVFVNSLPRFVENPTAFLEKMWYMQDYNPLMHHCCYCRYGALWRKATTFWLHGFTWGDPLMCTPGNGCQYEMANQSHPEKVGGSIGHSMQEKWFVPYELCMVLLSRMLLVRPRGTWFLTLFGGRGSFDRPCRVLGLTHVSVSFDRPTSVSDQVGGCIHVCLDLKRFSLEAVLGSVWHLTGLCEGDLVGSGCHPGCETFSYMSSRYMVRDNRPEGWHLPLTLDAMEADAVAHNAMCEFFPTCEGWYAGWVADL